jgi:hypothetical protein
VSKSRYNKEKKLRNFKYDIAISFAGEDRKIAKLLAKMLVGANVKVFYDEFFEHELWGKNLRKYFEETYGKNVRFVVPLISKYYPIKDWTDFEFSIMKNEAKKRQTEVILPIKLDETKMIGIHESIAYLDYRKKGINGIFECLLKKLSIEYSHQQGTSASTPSSDDSIVQTVLMCILNRYCKGYQVMGVFYSLHSSHKIKKRKND